MYVDPGLGALILQGFVGAIVGALYMARRRVVTLWRRLFPPRG